MIDLEYIEIDGLLYPNLALDDDSLYGDLGKYGNQRLKYLHEQKPQMYSQLLFSGKLAQHCADIERVAFEMVDISAGNIYGSTQLRQRTWNGYRHLHRHRWFSTILFIAKNTVLLTLKSAGRYRFVRIITYSQSLAQNGGTR